MGDFLSKKEQQDYHCLKSLITQANRLLDKTAVRSLTKCVSKNHYSLPFNVTPEEWEQFGRQLWTAANQNDNNAAHATVVWTLILTILESEWEKGEEGAPGSALGSGRCGQSVVTASGSDEAPNNITPASLNTVGSIAHLNTNSAMLNKGPGITPSQQPPQNGIGELLVAPPQNGGGRKEEEVFQAMPRPMTSEGEESALQQYGGSHESLHQVPPLSQDGDPHGFLPQAPTSLPQHPVQDDSILNQGLVQSTGDLQNMSPNNPFKPDYMALPSTNTLSSASQLLHLTRMDSIASKTKDFDDLDAIKAFPVFFDNNQWPSWEPIPVPLIKDAKRAIADYGLGSVYAMGVLNSLFQAFLFTPNDIKNLARTLLNNMQITMFLDERLACIRKYAHETVGATGRPVPQTIDMLFGTEQYAFNAVQMHVPANDLITTKTLAFIALQIIVDASSNTTLPIHISKAR
ncbi:hypothetical protein WISP_82118 [Willisornis vidua]|uniref:Uncharacterized protein n=1 Tax=Willisornis vidua TaxID=1566151 RepID=A0ABQ9DA26_9PASS|nr:hypothetical protein WISP_82118 [Willisornis vidua]